MTQFLFFSGKGGVGKTSMACTTAVRFADDGRRTLIVTTDPASNLADVFEQPIGHPVTPIAGVPNLWAMEIDPDRATQEYIDRRHGADPRRVFPPQMVQVMEEQMSGPCTAEVAAFDRFTDFLDAPACPPAGGMAFDVVIFDTAPTGHTLRLLELPAEWSKPSRSQRGRRPDVHRPGGGDPGRQAQVRARDAALRDPSRTPFVFVLHPEATAIKGDPARRLPKLGKLGITNHELIVNGIIPAPRRRPTRSSPRARDAARLPGADRAELPLPTRQVPLLDGEIKGVARCAPWALGAIMHRPTAGVRRNGATRRPCDRADDGGAW